MSETEEKIFNVLNDWFDMSQDVFEQVRPEIREIIEGVWDEGFDRGFYSGQSVPYDANFDPARFRRGKNPHEGAS